MSERKLGTIQKSYRIIDNLMVSENETLEIGRFGAMNEEGKFVAYDGTNVPYGVASEKNINNQNVVLCGLGIAVLAEEGLKAGTIGYIQNDGTIGSTVTAYPVFISGSSQSFRDPNTFEAKTGCLIHLFGDFNLAAPSTEALKTSNQKPKETKK